MLTNSRLRRVEIGGHTDSRGSTSYNQALSERRASAVPDYLVGLGVERSRIRIKPYGEGRVFYCSPSHFPESYESATLLQFLLDGVQYAAGDLKCDDSTP